eukprot:CAMPEP_0178993690 /NCGR_PEP_ID=MMETSP0795-20121207/6845_1 /TAXON_ID=88552 /ORGANISM="Amoebophrya sp., Strain Ameob2" /LENGTH=266 /DNA_ID=CAMNT_0020685781 /DNA_START=106 /DNA_END=906 /DNA_ORIENTATION=+
MWRWGYYPHHLVRPQNKDHYPPARAEFKPVEVSAHIRERIEDKLVVQTPVAAEAAQPEAKRQRRLPEANPNPSDPSNVMVGLQRGPPTKFITDQDCRKKIDFGWNNCTNSAFLAGRAQTRKPWETHVKQQYQGEKWHVENVLDRVMKSGTNFHNGGASGSAPSPSSAAPNRPPTPPVAEPHSTTTAPEVIDLTGESSAEEDEEQGKEKGTGQGPGLFPSPIGIKRATPAGSTGAGSSGDGAADAGAGLLGEAAQPEPKRRGEAKAH